MPMEAQTGPASLKGRSFNEMMICISDGKVGLVTLMV